MLNKNPLKAFFFFLTVSVITMIQPGKCYCQYQIHIVPNQPYPSCDGPLIICKNKLCLFYGNHLVEYDGTNFKRIANPDFGNISDAQPIICNDKLYFKYESEYRTYQLAQYDGTSITLIPNPDRGVLQGYIGSPIVFNNNLYIDYTDSAGDHQLAKYDGTTLSVVHFPSVNNFGYRARAFVFNNNLYISYRGSSWDQWYKYDGTKLTPLVNNDKAYDDGDYSNPIVLNDKLYFSYSQRYKEIFQISECNGSSLHVIPLPPNGGKPEGWQIIYDKKLCFSYTKGQISQLVLFDGNNFNFISNPDSGYGVSAIDSPFIYNNKLYFGYSHSRTTQLAQYDGKTITLFPNLDEDRSSRTLYYTHIVFNNKLYFAYHSGDDASSLTVNHLMQYDGKNFKLIPNLVENDNKSQYGGENVIYNNKLYFVYSSKLAYLEDSLK